MSPFVLVLFFFFFFFFVLVLLLSCFFLNVCLAHERAFFFGNLSDSETILSSLGTFRFGFFSPVNSTSRYAGIWYNSIPLQTVIWVANKDKPINDSSGVVSVSEDGNLVVTDGHRLVIWSTNLSTQSPANSTVLAELLDSGNLVMKDSNTDAYLWESFEYPTDSWLPNMLVGTNAKTGGGNITITSWKTPSDPSPGSYTAALVLAAYREIHIVNNNNKNATMWRSGPWNGQMFNGLPDKYTGVFLYRFIVNDDTNGTVTMSFANDSTLRHFYLDYKGSVIRRDWSEAKRNWTVGDQVPATECDVYRRCGQFPTCNPLKAPPCSCFKGFSPRNFVEWNSGNSSGGCIRKEPLQCERQNSNGSAADGFMRLRRVKLPDFARRSEASEPECLRTCLQTCSCVAFAHGLGYGCMTWNVSLVDSQDLSSSGMDLYIRLAHSEKPDRRPVIIGTSLASGVFVVAACGLLVQRIVKKRRGRKKGTEAEEIFERVEALAGGGSKGKMKELPLFEFQVLAAATDNFSLSNKLGQGGFGPVYKGKLQEGQEIAVKRLSQASGQGLEELVNEVVVISKLQHRNLVKLLGCCIAGEERMLVYEFMPNKSLDYYLFDPTKAKLLDWKTRFDIINGICRGLVYLHRDSRLNLRALLFVYSRISVYPS